MTSNNKSVQFSQGVLALSSALRLALSLGITMLVGRALSPEDYGFFALVTTLVAAAHGILDLGTGSIAAREIARQADQERSILESLLGWRRLCGVVLSVGVIALALTYGGERRWVLLGLAAVLPFMAYNGVYAAFVVRQAQGRPALVALGSQLSVLVGSLCFLGLKLSGGLFGWLLVVREGLYVLALKWFGYRLLGYAPRPSVDRGALGAFLAQALVYGVATLLHALYFHADVFLVAAIRGEAELGAYGAAFRLINPLLTVPWILMGPLLPVLAAVAATDRQRFAAQVGLAGRLGLGLGAVCTVTGVLLAPDVILLVYGGRYIDGPLAAVDAFRLLSVAFGAVWVMPVFATALLADRREKWLLVITLCGFLLNLVCNVAFIPRYGIVAAAATTAVTELSVCVAAYCAYAAVTGNHAVGLRWTGYLLPAAGVALLLPVLPGTAMGRAIGGAGLALVAAAVLLTVARRAGRSTAPADAPPVAGVPEVPGAVDQDGDHSGQS